MADEWVQRLMTKKLQGKFFKAVKDVFATQENALRTCYYCASILKEECKLECRMCGEHPETVMRLVSGCKKMAQTDY